MCSGSVPPENRELERGLRPGPPLPECHLLHGGGGGGTIEKDLFGEHNETTAHLHTM